MNWLGEQTVGRILTYYRNRLGLRVVDVKPMLPASWRESKISLLENDHAARPTRDILGMFAREYGISPLEYTYLLRAADYPPTEQEARAVYHRFQSGGAPTLYPAFVLTYRYDLVCWNQSFAELFTSADSASATTRSAELILPQDPDFAAFREDGSPPFGSLPFESSASISESPTGAAATESAPLFPLRVGKSFFELLFDRRLCSRFFDYQGEIDHLVPVSQNEKEPGTRLVDYFLNRFWRETMSLVQVDWVPRERQQEPLPLWLVELYRRMATLGVEGAEFVEASARIRKKLTGSWNDPSVQLIENAFLSDALLIQRRNGTHLLMPKELADARFTMYMIIPM